MAGMRRERRLTMRKAFSETITYDMLFKIGEGEKKEERREARCIDISDKGLCFETNYPLKEKEMLKLKLPLKEVSIASPVLGEVRWVSPVEADRFRVGIRFIV